MYGCSEFGSKLKVPKAIQSKFLAITPLPLSLQKNPVFHGRSKHIDVRFHFLRNLIFDGSISMEYYRTSEQVADIITKPMKLDQFEKLREALGIQICSDIN